MENENKIMETETLYGLYHDDKDDTAVSKRVNEALKYIMGYNMVEGFPVHELSKLFVREDGNSARYLPVSVKKAWLRIRMPMAHISDEPFGECNATVANVKVTVHPDERNDIELSHAYASASAEGIFGASYVNESERKTYLYKIAVGRATSAALTAAGFGMGYENDPDELYMAYSEKEEQKDPTENMVSEDCKTKQKPGEAEQADSPSERAQRSTDAAAAEKKLGEFRTLCYELDQLYSAASNEGYEAIVRDSSENALKASRKKFEKLLLDLKKRAEKGARNESNGISKVLNAEIIDAELKKLSEGLRRKLTGNTDIAESGETDERDSSVQEETHNEISEMAEDKDNNVLTADISSGEASGDDIMGYRFTSPDSKIAGKRPEDIPEDLLQWVCITTSPNVNAEDREAAIKAAEMLFSDERLEKLRRRLGR